MPYKSTFVQCQLASSLPSPSGDGNDDTSQQIACATQNQERGHLHYESTFFNDNPHLHCRRLQATEIVDLKCKFAISTQLLSSKRISKKELKIKIKIKFKIKFKFKCAAQARYHPNTEFEDVNPPTKPFFTSLHFTSLHFTSLHFTSLHFTSLHFTSLHFTSLHFTSLHFTSLHFTSFHSSFFLQFHIHM